MTHNTFFWDIMNPTRILEFNQFFHANIQRFSEKKSHIRSGCKSVGRGYRCDGRIWDTICYRFTFSCEERIKVNLMNARAGFHVWFMAENVNNTFWSPPAGERTAARNAPLMRVYNVNRYGRDDHLI